MGAWEGTVDGLVITLESEGRPSDDDFRMAAEDFLIAESLAATPAPPPTPQLNQRQLAQLPEGAAITPDKPGLYRSPGPIPAREGFRRATMTTPTGTTGPEKNETILGVPIPGSRVLLREAGGAFEAAGEPDVITTAERGVQRAEAKETLPTKGEFSRDLREFNPFAEQTETPEALYGPAGMKKKTRGEILAADQGGFVGELGGWYASLLNNPAGVLKTDPVEAGLELIGVAGPLRGLMKASKAKRAAKAAKGIPDTPAPQAAAKASPVAEEVEQITTTTTTPATTTPAAPVGDDVVDSFEQVMTANVADIEKVRRGVIPGGDSLPVPVSKSFQQAVDQARTDGVLDRVEALIDDVNSAPRPLSDSEGAAVMLHGRSLQDQHLAVQGRIKGFVNADRLQEAAEQTEDLARIEEAFYNTMSALRRSASERGRALNAQKMMIGKDYDVISMKARAIAARGKKLSPKEAKNIDRLAKNITDFTKAEEAILDRIAKRLGKERGELDVDVNGFPLEATSEELASLMAQRRLAVELKMAADLADLKAKDTTGYYRNLLLDMASTPKMLLASADLSAPGRQGVVLLSGDNSIANSRKVFGDMFGAVKGSKDEVATEAVRAGDQYAYKAQREIINGDVAGLSGKELALSRLKAEAARAAGIDYTSIGSRIDPQGVGPGGRLKKAEEQFAGNVFGDRLLRRMYNETDTGAFAEGMKKLNAYGEFSERTYSLPLNRLRKEKFLQMSGLDQAKTAEEAKEILQGLGQKNMKEIADFINMTTGRTKLPADLDKAGAMTRLLNAVFFSPKFAWSRAKTLYRPLVGAKRLASNAAGNHVETVAAEMKLMKELSTVGMKWGAAMSMFNMILPEDEGVNMDPSSSDFGKVRIGNTRYDTTGGLATMFRLMYRPAAAVASQENQKYGQGVGAQILQATRSKLSPLASRAVDQVAGSDFKGDPVDWSAYGVASDVAVPIVADETLDLYNKYGVVEGLARLAPSVFGIGATDYKDRK